MKKKKLGFKEFKNKMVELQADIRNIGYQEVDSFADFLTLSDEEIKSEISNVSDILKNLPASYHSAIIHLYRKNKLDQLRNAQWLANNLSKITDEIFDLAYDG